MTKAKINAFRVLTEDEIQHCREVFLEFDEDKSGTIDLWELKKVLTSMGQTPSEEDLIRMIAEMDDDESNSIDFTEFLQVIARQKMETKDTKNKDITAAWSAVGGNHDFSGYVDTDLLINILKVEYKLDIDIEEMIDKVDTSGDGKIDFREFVAMFTAS